MQTEAKAARQLLTVIGRVTPSVLQLGGGVRADGGAAAGDDDDDDSDDDDDDGSARSSKAKKKKKKTKRLRDSQQANDRDDDNAASDDDDDGDLLTSKKRLTHAAALKLGDSCTWSEGSRDMMLSVYRSHNAFTTDYVCHVAQFCEDSNISQECYCWPYVLEIAGRNVRAALQDGSYPARELKNLVALARCPSAHDAGHCHAQRERLADALMAQLASEPYLQEA